MIVNTKIVKRFRASQSNLYLPLIQHKMTEKGLIFQTFDFCVGRSGFLKTCHIFGVLLCHERIITLKMEL